MIGKLRGLIDTVADGHVIIDVGGVGYVAFASATTLRSLPPEGVVSLFIETHVREDHIHLYGFATAAEQRWFNILIKVNGIGAKVALGILSCLAVEQLASAIAAQDKAVFKAVSGVGPKLAERLLVELKGKADVAVGAVVAIGGAVAVGDVNAVMVQDTVSALANLGYGRAEVMQVASRIVGEKAPESVEELIRLSLREMAA